MENDVAIDRAALAHAKFFLSSSISRYRISAEHSRARDTGVGNPCGRVHLRVALENAVGAALMRVREEVEDGGELVVRLQAVIDSFAELDASLGKGWNPDHVVDLP